MLLREKIGIIVVLPLLILATYQFFSIENIFNVIDEVRAHVFVESAKEIKYASDVQFMTALMNSTLWEIENTYETKDRDSFSRSLRLYREIQQQRYYALQELKETVNGSRNYAFAFIVNLDQNKIVELEDIEKTIQHLDVHNEEIITILTSSYDLNQLSEERRAHIFESNTLTREVVSKLSSFTNTRYIKVDETSKLVERSEKDARSLMLLVAVLGYLISGIIIVFFYMLVILPLERFARAIELGRMDTIAWTALEPFRKDEVGQVYRALEKCFVHSQASEKIRAEKKTGSRKKSRRGKNNLLAGKNGNARE